MLAEPSAQRPPLSSSSSGSPFFDFILEKPATRPRDRPPLNSNIIDFCFFFQKSVPFYKKTLIYFYFYLEKPATRLRGRCDKEQLDLSLRYRFSRLQPSLRLCSLELRAAESGPRCLTRYAFFLFFYFYAMFPKYLTFFRNNY
jgi:hypothetical protein